MLKPFLLILAALVAIPTICWGFPGGWALLAIVPAFVVGATIAHARAPRPEGAHMRPGVLVLGGVFGLTTGAVSVLFMQAAVAPEEISVTHDLAINASPERVWDLVTDWEHRSDWETWISELEPVGAAGALAVGSRFRSKLSMERLEQYGEHVVTALDPGVSVTWTVEPQSGGWRVEDVRETITLAPEGDGTRVTYAIGYAVPSVLGRVIERVVVRQSFRKVAEQSLENLAGAALEQAPAR